MLSYKEVFELAQSKGYVLQFVKTIESVIPEGWELFRVKEYCKGKLDVKVRKTYDENELKLNEDGYKYQSLFIDKVPEDQTILIELTLIQKWLRDTHKISIAIVPLFESKGVYNAEIIKAKRGIYKVNGYVVTDYFDDYEPALLAGINAALQLI